MTATGAEFVPGETPPPLVVLGASARAVAESAARAGWRVHAADLFGDADLRAVASVADRNGLNGGGYPRWLPDAARRFPAAPWIYTGALENHPDLLEAIAAERPLAGTGGAAVRVVRDVDRLAAVVRAAGLEFPDTRTGPAGVPTDGSWLVKPRRSAGGRGIEPWRGQPLDGVRATECVWQRRVAGVPWSASYLCASGTARLFGASRQLVGEAWCRARPFAWCGAVDVRPEEFDPCLRSRLDDLGAAIAAACALAGLVGVDLVVDPRGLPHVLEVNPRPTASLELVERAAGASFAAAHLAACGIASPPHVARSATAGTWTKCVLFAAADVAVNDALVARLFALRAAWGEADGGWPGIGDIPCAGVSVTAGAPLVTVFAHGAHAAAAIAALQARAAEVEATVRSP